MLSDLQLPYKSKEEKCLLSGILRNGQERSGSDRFPEVLEETNYERLLHSSGAATSVDENVGSLLLAIARHQPEFGHKTPPEPKKVWAARSYLCSDRALQKLAIELASAGLIEPQGSNWSTDLAEFALTLAGWREVAKLRSTRGAGNQCFVAMWFDDALDAVFQDGILPALEATGYRIFNAKTVPMEEKIDDRIMAEIRRSSLVVADVTGDRANVYFEAGFALGLGIPVLWCCNKAWETRLPERVLPHGNTDPPIITTKWTSRLHFDTDHYQHLLYESADDLKSKIEWWIRGLGLARR